MAEMFAPDGTVKVVPDDQVQAAIAAGGRPATRMLSPRGEPKFVPADMVAAALKNGGTLLPGVPAPTVPPELQQYNSMNDTTLPSVGLGAAPMSARTANMMADQLTGAPVGAAKGISSTLLGAGKAAALNFTYPGKGRPYSLIPDPKPEILNPAPNEKAGYYGEQAAEFLAPGGIIGDTMKGAKALPIAARIASRAGLEGLSAAAISALHGDEHPVVTGAVGAAGGALSEGLSEAAPLLKDRAVSLYSKALSPSTKANKALTQKIVPELLDQGEWGGLKTLSSKAQDVKDEAGPQIDSYLQAHGDVPQSIRPTMQALDDYKQQFLSSNGTVLNENAVNAVEKLKTQLTDMASSGTAPTKDLVKMRRVLDTQVAKAGGYAGTSLADGSTADAMREGANSIRAELAKSNPDLAALNSKYSLWSNVQKVADATLQRRTGQVGGILGGGTAEVAGAVADGIKGGFWAGAANAAKNVATSPTLRTGRAVLWSNLGRMIESGQLAEASKIATKIGSAAILEGTSPATSALLDNPTSNPTYSDIQREVARDNPDPNKLSQLYNQGNPPEDTASKVKWQRLGSAIEQNRYTEAAKLARQLQEGGQ